MVPLKNVVESNFYVRDRVCIAYTKTPVIHVRPVIAQSFYRIASKVFSSSFISDLIKRPDEIKFKGFYPFRTEGIIEREITEISAKSFFNRSPWTSYLILSASSKLELGLFEVDYFVEGFKCTVSEKILNPGRTTKHILFRHIILALVYMIFKISITTTVPIHFIEILISKKLPDFRLKNDELLRLAPFRPIELEDEVCFVISIDEVSRMGSLFDKIPRSIEIPRLNQMKLYLRNAEKVDHIWIPPHEPMTLQDLSLSSDGVDKIIRYLKGLI
jgi:hypothetical protein